MNYPLRTGILQYILEQKAELLANVLKEIYATYPKCVCDCLMNLLGTHDTERILTVLGEGKERVSGESNDTLSKKRLTEAQYDRGVAYLKLAATIQYTVYGVPSVFYGDEAGLEGYHDPFCRRPYPWGKENRELLEYYRTLGKIRQNHSVFTDGSFHITYAKDELLSYVREGNGDRITVLVNVGEKESPYAVADSAVDLLTDSTYGGVIPPRSAVILQTTIES
jgi:glycosidase